MTEIMIMGILMCGGTGAIAFGPLLLRARAKMCKDGFWSDV
jgi:hypothetical protein